MGSDLFLTLLWTSGGALLALASVVVPLVLPLAAGRPHPLCFWGGMSGALILFAAAGEIALQAVLPQQWTVAVSGMLASAATLTFCISLLLRSPSHG